MKCVIIGAGPTGLAAALRCEQLGLDWELLEANAYAGGLSASFEADGFTWDLGGHIVFSHYAAFDRLLDSLLAPAEWLVHERRTYIRALDRWIPYPFQNNIRHLPPAERDECLAGLQACAQAPAAKPRNFQEWIDAHNGAGIARIFLNPYNYKVWGYPPRLLSAGWLGDRVARPDVSSIARSIREGTDDTTWGLNRTFRFPRRGGTGAIWQRLAARLPRHRQRYGAAVTGIDSRQRTVRTADGSATAFDRLISTVPLDRLCAMLDAGPPAPGDALLWNSVHVVGLGFRGALPEAAADKSWLYFPEARVPFYRVTVFSNYSPHNAPDGCYALMAEVAESPLKPVDARGLRADCERGLRELGLAAATQALVHAWTRRIDYAYPVPGLGRDAVLAEVLPALEARHVYSRGRFGAWKYEVGNMDHSFAQGTEVVDRIAEGKPETTLNEPDRVNNPPRQDGPR